MQAAHAADFRIIGAADQEHRDITLVAIGEDFGNYGEKGVAAIIENLDFRNETAVDLFDDMGGSHNFAHAVVIEKHPALAEAGVVGDDTNYAGVEGKGAKKKRAQEQGFHGRC
jgi:hypothetical protein